MQVSEAKKLKVGDKVRIKRGSRRYEYYVSGMDQAVGQTCTVVKEYSPFDNDIRVSLEFEIGGCDELYFPPSWIECKVEESKEPTKVTDSVATSKQHHKAEVLRWIADGEEVEYQTTASKAWTKLDTSVNFSISESFKYRKSEKKYQILCKDNSIGKYYIAKGLFSKEEALKRDDLVKVLE